jgi:hypothetical protein
MSKEIKAIKLSEEVKTDDKPISEVKDLAKKARKDKIKTPDYERFITIDGKKYNKDEYASPLQNNSTLPPIMSGLEVPSQTKGPFSHIDKERWYAVVEGLLSRNVKSARQISKITGLAHQTANGIVNDIKEMWQSDLTPQKVNVRREKLYAENERIADFCWQLVQLDPLAKEVPQFLKIIGDTNTRRSRLVGAEQITLAVGQKIDTTFDTQVIQTQAAAKLGVSVTSLKSLGDNLATAMLPNYSEESEEENDKEEQDT